MADAFTAVADDPTALYWNPAGLALLKGTGLSTTHGQWLQGVTNDHLALSHRLGNEGGVGLGFTLQNTHAFAAALEDSMGNYAGTGPSVAASDWALSLAYGDRLGRFLKGGLFETTYAGLKVNLLGQSAFSIEGTAVSFEAGFLHEMPKERLMFGLAIQNIGTPLQERSQPVLFKAGASWHHPGSFNPGDRLTLALDLDIHDDTGFRPSLGTEYWTPFASDLKGALRAGVRATDDLAGFSAMTFGAGLAKEFGNFNAGLDYAFVPYGAIGATHRFTLNMSLPGAGLKAPLTEAAAVPAVAPPLSQPAPAAPANAGTEKPKAQPTLVIAPQEASGSAQASPDKPATTPASPSPVSLDQGMDHMRAGRYQEALGIFQAAVAKDPKDQKASQLLANCLAKMGRLDEAQKVIERSMKGR
jgi:hypothetical protein